jgi:probable HAF family extracellular repeat protein
MEYPTKSHVQSQGGKMKFRKVMCITAITLLAPSIPVGMAAQEHPRYKLVDLGTLGGPQSFGDAGHGAGNINNRGTAVGVADTATPDPNYPNFNPLMNAFGADPFIFHAFGSTDGAALVDLGALPGTNNSNPIWISANGLIAGASLNGTIDPLTGWPEATAVLWKDGQIINLGTLGGYESEAFSVDRHGQVVGFSGNTISDPYSILGLGTETRAFLWRDGKMQDLGTLGGPDAFATAMNEKGQVSGFSYLDSVPNPYCTLTTGAFLWERDKMVNLGSLGGSCTGPGIPGMNNRGQVVGGSNLAGDTESHAFLWEKGTLTDLSTLGGTFSAATAINDAGEVSGGATIAGDLVVHAFFWKQGVMTDIGTVGGDDCSFAFDINSTGQVVGQSFQCNVNTVPHAFLWEHGHIIDLNDFVPSGSSLTLLDAERNNDRGEIFGIGSLPNGELRAFVLIPCQNDDDGCQGESPTGVTQTSPALVMQNPTASGPSPSERMAAIRARLAHRYPYHSFGTYQPK